MDNNILLEIKVLDKLLGRFFFKPGTMDEMASITEFASIYSFNWGIVSKSDSIISGEACKTRTRTETISIKIGITENKKSKEQALA